ncbi:diacylglycerol/lipid kinase family protein [Treponema sp. R80B11-R83G3]
MKHVFVFDPKAFYGQQWKMDNILDNIGQFFRTQEAPNFSIQFSRYRRNAITIIQDEAEKAKPDDIIRVYAIGGEEILFDCLNGVAHFQNMQLAAVPHGESYDFLHIFGESNIESFRDIPSLVKGKALQTDIIRWGVNYALNSCYIGMNSAILKRIKDLKSNMNKGSFIAFSKLSSYFNTLFGAFDKNVAAREYKITIDDADYSGQYCLIHVANSPYHDGKMTGVSGASPDDGVLDIALIKPSHPMGTLSSMRKYSKGKRPRNCAVVHGKKISIQTAGQMWIQLDNEYIQDTNITMNVINHAVQMVTINNLSYPSTSMTAV